MDHRSLTHLKPHPNLNQRQIRWMERAADYDCEILYKPDKENVIADALARIQTNALSQIFIHILPKSCRNPVHILPISLLVRKDG